MTGTLPARQRGNSITPPLLQATDLTWHSPQKDFTLTVSSLTLRKGECLGVIGPSGCGKSTLLGLLSLALHPSDIIKLDILGKTLAPYLGSSSRMGTRDPKTFLTAFRAKHIGFIPQTGGLVPFLTARENINLALRVLENPPSPSYASQHISKLAERLEITACLEKLPSQLSVGQRQRVAIARALIHQPPILLADEPTAPLHPSQASIVLDLLRNYADEYKAGVIVVSHDIAALKKADFTLLPAQLEGCSTIISNGTSARIPVT